MSNFHKLNIGTRVVVAFALLFAFAGALFAARPASADVWNPGKLQIYATDVDTHQPVADALVTVYDSYGNKVAEGMTSSSGYWSTSLGPGGYKVDITSNAYVPYSASTSVQGGQLSFNNSSGARPC